jgi:hypothetical protein
VSTTGKIQPYNPLDKLNLAKSIEIELLGRSGIPLSLIDGIFGAGVYAIYYAGAFPAYASITLKSEDSVESKPIYVGKAIPKGGRKGGLSRDASATGNALADRLRQHASSISEASNLQLADFSIRHLVLDDIWIPLGENMLIESFKPVWNVALDGFGNKDPGMRRATQYKSPWDVVHPGRQFAEKLAVAPASAEFLIQRIKDYLAGKPLAKLPRVLAEQGAAEQAEAEEAADEA